MKLFKKVILVIMVFSISLLFTGCGNKNIEGKLDDLMKNVYKDLPKDHTPMLLENHEINDENIENFLGTKDIEYEEALASESGVGSIAHSVVLVRLKDNADVEKAKETIKKNINPRKWVCVGVEDDEVVIKNRGNLIIVIIEDDENDREILEKGFDNL